MKQNTQNGKYITIMHTRFLYKIKQEHVKHKHYIQLYKTETKQYKKCDKRKSHISSIIWMWVFSFKTWPSYLWRKNPSYILNRRADEQLRLSECNCADKSLLHPGVEIRSSSFQPSYFTWIVSGNNNQKWHEGWLSTWTEHVSWNYTVKDVITQ